MPEQRFEDLKRFYSILDGLTRGLGGVRGLCDSDGRMSWPARGVYFFFEDGENRADSGAGARVVRVGTHALKRGSKTSLWNRLSQHRGVRLDGRGNHRGSVFRLHVGTALSVTEPGLRCPSWAHASTAPAAVRRAEQWLESVVSGVIGKMPLLWLRIDDAAGPGSERAYIERNAIALLSNFNKPSLDPPSPKWLGRHCASARVRDSGLWNSDYVDENYDPRFLDRFEALVRSTA